MSKDDKNIKQACFELSVDTILNVINYLTATATALGNKEAYEHLQNARRELSNAIDHLQIEMEINGVINSIEEKEKNDKRK